MQSIKRNEYFRIGDLDDPAKRKTYGVLLAFAFLLGFPMFMFPIFMFACSLAFMFPWTLAFAFALFVFAVVVLALAGVAAVFALAAVFELLAVVQPAQKAVAVSKRQKLRFVAWKSLLCAKDTTGYQGRRGMGGASGHLNFWSPDASGYTNDSLIGSLVIAFSVLVPMMPGKAHHMMMMQPGPDLPRGWTYNPSTWQQRAPIIALAFVGFFCARYLAAFQLGYINRVWDPFFVDDTRRVLQSDVSRAWPISDAGLGALSYMLEGLSGFMGGVQRWRTMPWMVAMFGFLVVPLGVTSIVLVILQPLMVGAWCTLCLITAIAMLIMVPLAVDEVVAMFQFLAQAHREGKPMWRTFWIGGTLDDRGEDKRTPRLTAPVARALPAMTWGVNIPWTLLVSSAVGIWLMFAPSVFATQGRAADSDHLVGALVVTFAVIAMAEVTRAARLINILFGAG